MPPKIGPALLCAAALLAGCAPRSAGQVIAPPKGVGDAVNWRRIATDSDRERIRGWRTAWMNGLGSARQGGHSAALAREGALLLPDAALPWQALPPGPYRCRTIKLGARSEGNLAYVAYPVFDCRVRLEGGLLSFAKLGGSQRPLGLIFPDTPARMIFLGTLQLSDERSPLQYGRDRERDLAGIVERIGERKWRIVFPYPAFESLVDIMELVPTPGLQEGNP